MARKASKNSVWKLASEYNRRKDAIDDYVQCVSCGKSGHWKSMDAGHFIPKARGKAVYFIPTNIHAQCPGCNRFDVERSKIGYTLYMLNRYGLAHIEELRRVARTVTKQTQSDLDAWSEFYITKLEELDNAKQK